MRVTKRQRFLRRVQSDVFVRTFHRCVSCQADVKREAMHRFRDEHMHGNRWLYLCYTCAPNRDAAIAYWQKEERCS